MLRSSIGSPSCIAFAKFSVSGKSCRISIILSLSARKAEENIPVLNCDNSSSAFWPYLDWK